MANRAIAQDEAGLTEPLSSGGAEVPDSYGARGERLSARTFPQGSYSRITASRSSVRP